MRKIAVFVLLVVVVVVAVLVGRRGGPGEEGPPELRFQALWEEAFARPDSTALGAAWPEDEELAELRRQWSALGTADSTLVERLIQDWIHPASREPYRITGIPLAATGGTPRSLEDRLELAGKFLEHPRWRMGSMRLYPAVAIALSPQEKDLLQYLAREGNDRPHTTRELTEVLGMPAEELEPVLGGLTGIGWLLAEGDGEARTYRIRDPRVADGGAFLHVTFAPTRGRSFDATSLAVILARETKTFRLERVSISGPCTQTGRRVQMETAVGRLHTGRPGAAYAAEITPAGLSNGLFASQEAFRAWLAEHPRARVGRQGRLPAFFRNFVAAPEGGEASAAP